MSDNECMLHTHSTRYNMQKCYTDMIDSRFLSLKLYTLLIHCGSGFLWCIYGWTTPMPKHATFILIYSTMYMIYGLQNTSSTNTACCLQHLNSLHTFDIHESPMLHCSLYELNKSTINLCQMIPIWPGAIHKSSDYHDILQVNQWHFLHPQ